jgi:hypothetical protein
LVVGCSRSSESSIRHRHHHQHHHPLIIIMWFNIIRWAITHGVGL